MDLILTYWPDVHAAILQADPANLAQTQVALSGFYLTTCA